ncbi:response regulator SaeR [bacterium BMS3Abin07]|nr:response regulator SaeR [bacterium BMS3Abin07]GBE32133.1 response regulator SaeR [bacterium BMS3Bbin05]HDL20605.1 response regulator transcription factor [Nitrospirota bacterium]HDO22215.1 response regulator transcription factor [Nitrospirota bacterium]HDZ88846.1 response regulator transcription factor [Nitrospirota bacterium]
MTLEKQKKKSVILLEDSRETALYIRDVLNIFDFSVKHLTSPIDSFSLLNDADLMILDYNLPKMNGIEYLKFLNMNFPHIPVIMITGYGSENICLHAFRLGVRDYLKKPFSPAELREVVTRCLRINESSFMSNHKGTGNLDPGLLNKLYLAKNYIDRNISAKLELGDVLRIACMSKVTFNKHFKFLFGTTFKNYLLENKIDKAKQMLRDGLLSVSEIAYSLGFNDSSHFTKAFKKFEGIPPSRFRSG